MKTRTQLSLTISLLCLTAVIVHATTPALIWAEDCSRCHGPNGKGQTKMGQKLKIRDLTDSKILSTKTDEQIAAVIANGLKDSEGKELMRPRSEDIPAADRPALVKYVRAFAGK